MDNAQVTIFLTPSDMELFKKFQQHYGVFKLLSEKGVFDVKYGTVKLSFQSNQLVNIVKEESVYRAAFNPNLQ